MHKKHLKHHRKHRLITRKRIKVVMVFVVLAIFLAMLTWASILRVIIPIAMLAVFIGLYARWIYTAFKTGSIKREWEC